MSLSRRQFTKEFKLAAIQRLEMGASVAEVARAFESQPRTYCTVGRRESAKGLGMRFPVWGSGAGKRAGGPTGAQDWPARSWRSISAGVLAAHRTSSGKLQALNGKPLSTSRSKTRKKRGQALTVERMCALGR